MGETFPGEKMIFGSINNYSIKVEDRGEHFSNHEAFPFDTFNELTGSVIPFIHMGKTASMGFDISMTILFKKVICLHLSNQL
jgi:hypothetical protein